MTYHLYFFSILQSYLEVEGNFAEDEEHTLLKEKEEIFSFKRIVWWLVSSYHFSAESVCFIRNDFYNLKKKYVPEIEFTVAYIWTHLGVDVTPLYFSTTKTSKQCQVT